MSEASRYQVAEPMRAFVDREVEAGHYASADAVVEAGLRLLDDYETRHAALQAALDEGEASGIATEFDFDEFLSRMRAKYTPR